MKHIKTYEKIISAKSEEAKINPLYDFSGRITQILKNKALKESDPIFSSTKRYIEDDGIITIRTNPAIRIVIDYDERLNVGHMLVRVSFVYKSMGLFYNYIKNQLNQYIYLESDKDHYIKFKFSIEDTPDILKKLEEYETYLLTTKFNI